ncbi:diguanylate cyclase DgcA [Treponema sp.]|uniref:diguanylate cyclase DgcA n=1 Tax=Treponema sp. TaxID=166 RepID=UPI00257F1B4F|nr:diguanylate cyclase DgcA [Treponema sp.]MBE6353251.1 GGDEF domain-containing protein [Treponema sp.]
MGRKAKHVNFSRKASHHYIRLQPVVSVDEEMTIPMYEKQVYDLQQLLEISRSLCSTLELDKLIESIFYIVMAQMRVNGVGLFIKPGIETEKLTLDTNFTGLEPDSSIKYEIAMDSEFYEQTSFFRIPFELKEMNSTVKKTEEFKMMSSLNPSIVVPLVLKNRVNGYLVLGERLAIGDEDAAYSDYEKEELFNIASLASVAVNNASLVEQSSTDMMTRLKLKYYFFNILTDKIDAAYLRNEHLSVLMFDIDFFKKFNDNYGHACGDYVLQEVARIISENIGPTDMAARYGGEEFTVMLPGSKKEEALEIAERIRSKIEENDFFYENQHMKVTISCGVSELSMTYNPVTSAKAFVDQADKALYVSKRNGRNRVTFADESVFN